MLDKIRSEHGCQIIVNGVFDTIKYYLRLIQNTDQFIDRYLTNLSSNKEIPSEYKIAWNNLVKGN